MRPMSLRLYVFLKRLLLVVNINSDNPTCSLFSVELIRSVVVIRRCLISHYWRDLYSKYCLMPLMGQVQMRHLETSGLRTFSYIERRCRRYYKRSFKRVSQGHIFLTEFRFQHHSLPLKRKGPESWSSFDTQ